MIINFALKKIISSRPLFSSVSSDVSEEISERFNPEIAQLVEGVTKITRDFFGDRDVFELAQRLEGNALERGALIRCLEGTTFPASVFAGSGLGLMFS